MYNKNLVRENGKFYTLDLNSKERRLWDPYRSKLCAGLANGLQSLPIKEGDSVLYLGCAEGYTCSFVSDLVGVQGIVYGVDISPYSMQKFVLLSKERANLVPVLWDANKLDKYELLEGVKVDVIVQDVAQKNQVEILTKNARQFLEKNKHFILSLKTSSIAQKSAKEIIEEETRKLEKDFEILERKRLEPFEKKHILIVGRP